MTPPTSNGGEDLRLEAALPLSGVMNTPLFDIAAKPSPVDARNAAPRSDRKRRRGTVTVQYRADHSLRQNHALPPLAVVVVTYNSADVLPGLLDSLEDGLADIAQQRIIIVDNDSADASAIIARLHPLHPEVIETGRNAGYAAGINIAAAQLSPDSDLLVLNPDSRLQRGVARRLQIELRKGNTGIVVPRLLNHDGTLAYSLRREPTILTAWSNALLGGRLSQWLGTGDIIGDPDHYEVSREIEWATGAVLMISAAARQRVGPWDESFFLYSEEVDYMRRTRAAGFSVQYISDVEVTHFGGEYTANPFLTGLLTANMIRDFGRRHGKLSTALFRLGLAAGAALRAPFGPAHRASLKAALTAPTA